MSETNVLKEVPTGAMLKWNSSSSHPGQPHARVKKRPKPLLSTLGARNLIRERDQRPNSTKTHSLSQSVSQPGSEASSPQALDPFDDDEDEVQRTGRLDSIP